MSNSDLHPTKAMNLKAGQTIIINGEPWTIKSATRWHGDRTKVDLVVTDADGYLTATMTTYAARVYMAA